MLGISYGKSINIIMVPLKDILVPFTGLHHLTSKELSSCRAVWIFPYFLSKEHCSHGIIVGNMGLP